MKKKVYVIEDELHIRRLIQMVVEKCGFEPKMFDCGDQALESLKNGDKPDLILLDIMMPGRDGMDVLRDLKGHPEWKEFPVIMLTALTQQNVVLQGIKLGAIDYIRKPFHPQKMMERLRKQLGSG